MIRNLWHKFNNSEVLKFIFVGGLNTVVGYGFFALFVVLGLHHILAVTIAHVIGMAHSYFWNKFFTFRVKGKSWREFIKFITVYTWVYIVNVFLLWLFVDFFGFPPLVVQAIVLLVIVLISFLGQKYWAFKS